MRVCMEGLVVAVAQEMVSAGGRVAVETGRLSSVGRLVHMAGAQGPGLLPLRTS